jgi:hypothetical protein
MQSVKGIFEDGLAKPIEPVQGHNGRSVTITFVDEDDAPLPANDVTWNDLMQFIDDYAVDTGIEDLAHQHDHYLRGTPKQELYP